MDHRSASEREAQEWICRPENRHHLDRIHRQSAIACAIILPIALILVTIL